MINLKKSSHKPEISPNIEPTKPIESHKPPDKPSHPKNYSSKNPIGINTITSPKKQSPYQNLKNIITAKEPKAS